MSTLIRPLSPRMYRNAPLSALPFIDHKRRSIRDQSNWKPQPVMSYAEACALGVTYAAHFLAYLQDNPSLAGANVLGSIVRQMDFANETDAKGIIVGFLSTIERYAYLGARGVDVFQDAAHEIDWIRQVEAARAAEAEVPENLEAA